MGEIVFADILAKTVIGLLAAARLLRSKDTNPTLAHAA